MATTRDRIVTAGAQLFRRQGYTGTGVKQIVAEASAPFGSLYHFFPGGKEHLAEEVVRWSGALYGQLIAAVFDPAPDVVTGVLDAFTGAAERLVDSDYADACPIATIALEVASVSEPMRKATADVFTSWLDLTAERFARAGIEEDRARELAVVTLSSLEGAFVLCRSLRSVEPLHAAGNGVAELVRAALSGPGASSGLSASG